MLPARDWTSSPDLVAYIKGKEELRLLAYPDPKTGGDPWTVGYGATGPGIKEGTRWSLQTADDRIQADIEEREQTLYAAVTVPVTQGQFDALLSILFNVGAGSRTKDGIIWLKSGRPSTLLRKLNEGDYEGARDEFPKWCSPGSNVERGLRIRRNEEVEFFWDRV